MLICIALLTTIESVSIESIYDHDISDIRKAGLILAQFLSFAQRMDSSWRLNENGWKSKVLEKVDEFDTIIEGRPGIENVLAEIRET